MARESLSRPTEAVRGAVAAQVGSQQLQQREEGATFLPC